MGLEKVQKCNAGVAIDGYNTNLYYDQLFNLFQFLCHPDILAFTLKMMFETLYRRTTAISVSIMTSFFNKTKDIFHFHSYGSIKNILAKYYASRLID